MNMKKTHPTAVVPFHCKANAFGRSYPIVLVKSYCFDKILSV